MQSYPPPCVCCFFFLSETILLLQSTTTLFVCTTQEHKHKPMELAGCSIYRTLVTRGRVRTKAVSASYATSQPNPYNIIYTLVMFLAQSTFLHTLKQMVHHPRGKISPLYSKAT